MDKRAITKRIIQAVAVLFGLSGLMMVSLGVCAIFQGILESDGFTVLCMTPMYFLTGGIGIAVAWQNLRRFGPNAIKSLTCLVSLTLYGFFIPDEPSVLSRIDSPLIEMALCLLPLLLAFAFYRAVSKKLIQLAIPPTRGHPTRNASLLVARPLKQDSFMRRHG